MRDSFTRMSKLIGLRQKVQKNLTNIILAFIIFYLLNINNININNGILSNNITNSIKSELLIQRELKKDTTIFCSPKNAHSEKTDKNDMFNVQLSQLLSGPFTLPDDDPALVHHIRDALNAPPTEGLLKLDNSVKKEDPVHAGQVGQVLEVEKYFENKEGGFYVEAGAWDGEWLSNTLFLEVKRNWTGLLVEPNLGAFTTLMGRNRKSYTINCCLATKGYPEKVTFDAADVFGGIVDPDSDQGGAVPQLRDSIPKDMRAKYTVQCYPLYSLLLAMGNPRVDFLSLDIEGSELAVLQTMPWSKVNIEMVMVEVEHSDVSQVTKVMNKAGFMKYKSFGMQDVIYVKNKENTLG